MKFNFLVGVQEQHQSTSLSISSSATSRLGSMGSHWTKTFACSKLKLTRRYKFTVGEQERHQIAIKKKRRLFLAGLRPQQYGVFVDGQLVQTHEG